MAMSKAAPFRCFERIAPPTARLCSGLAKRISNLTSKTLREGRTSRKLYTITDKRHEGLAVARFRLRELKGEAGTE